MAWTLVIGLISGGMSVAAREMGLREGTPPTVELVLPDDNCPSPCWHGIRPAVISQAEGERLISKLPDVTRLHSVAWQWGELELWYAGGLSVVAKHMRLGDILAALGTPNYQKTQTVIERATNQTVQIVYLYYEKPQIIVIVSAPLDGRISVEMPLATIQYPNQYYARPFYTWEWLGAIWLERYPPVVEQH